MQNKTCTKCDEEKVLSLFGKRGDRYRSECNDCRKIDGKEYYQKNKIRHAELSRQWRLANPDRMKELKDRWKINNPERYRESIKKCRDTNPDLYKLQTKKYREQNKEREILRHKEYYEKNKEAAFAKSAARRALKLNAMPPWANKERITNIYKEARKVSLETGVLHHVDHIIPLKGENVTGLHVEYNLQIIPAIENFRKSNRVIINE